MMQHIADEAEHIYIAYTEVLIILKFIGAFGVFSLFNICAIFVVINIPESLATAPVENPPHHKTVLPDHDRHCKDAYFVDIAATIPDFASHLMTGFYDLKVVLMYQQGPVLILVLMAEA